MKKKITIILITQILSLLPLISLGIFVWAILVISLSATGVIPNGPAIVHGTMQIHFTDWKILFAFFCSIPSIIINAIIGLTCLLTSNYFGINEKYFKRLLIFSGTISSTFTFILKGKKVHAKKKNKFFLPITSVGVMGIATIVPIPLTAIVLTMKSIDDPSPSTRIKLSSKYGNENIFKLFTDGLDWEYLKPELEKRESTYKDFFVFSNFVTSGFNTYTSVKPIHGTWKNNIFDYHLESKEFLPKDLTAKDLTSSSKDFLNQFEFLPKEYKDSRKYMIGTHGFGNKSFPQDWSGNYDFAKSQMKGLPDLDIVNWSRARKDVAKNGLYTSNSPDINLYDFIKKKIELENDKNNKRSFVALNEAITHEPIMTGSDGSFEPMFATEKTAYSAIFSRDADIINKLKKTKDTDGNSLYDNSMIVIYGDHGSHARYSPAKFGKIDPNKPLLKNVSSAIIKFPHVVKDKITISHMPFFAPNMLPAMNRFFSFPGYLNNPNHLPLDSQKLFEYIFSNSNFDPNKKFLTFLKGDSVLVSKYVPQKGGRGSVFPVKLTPSEAKLTRNDYWINPFLQTSVFRKYSDPLLWKEVANV